MRTWTPRSTLRGSLAALLLASLATTACAPEEYNPLPSDETADQIAECGYTVDFDRSDPNDYVWTVRAEAVHTLGILQGSVEVHYRRFAAGVDPETGTPENSGQLRLDQFGSLPSGVGLAHQISYDDLVNGTFTMHTVRAEDKLAMTSCAQSFSIEDVIASHNGILSDGYPDFMPPEDVTDPAVFGEMLSKKEGVVMLVNSDCDIPNLDGNAEETRSVLSWLAVTVIAAPAPELVDPFQVQGINFEAKANEGSFCQDSPYDWTWNIQAHTAQTQIGNSADFPGTKEVTLHVNDGIFDNGLAADNVQVDPLGDLSAEEGIILTDYSGEPVKTEDIDAIINDTGGLTFTINRDDFGDDKIYASCSANISMEQLEITATSDTKLHLVKSKFLAADAPANHVLVTCDDGYLGKLGLHYLDISIKMDERDARHAMPPRPNLNNIVADTPLRSLAVETNTSEAP